LEFEQVGTTMGTTFSVKIPKLPDGVDAAELRKEINDTLTRVDLMMSTYKPDSELSRLNQNRSTEWIGISAELAVVLDEALRISELSGGAYDVTVGALVNLWGFGPGEQEKKIPAPAEILREMKKFGFKKIRLNADKTAVRKEHPELYIDLSSIAQGYGADQVAELISGFGINHYLIDVSGEMRAGGTKADGTYWNIAIEKPVEGVRTVEQTIQVKDVAIATSGDYRNFFEVDGVRYSHTIDPRTGRPISHGLASVTVLDKTAMRADALATALIVLGPEAGFSLAEKLNVGALFISRGADGFVTMSTSAFAFKNE
jgi:FAD:protein FMN transferase